MNCETCNYKKAKEIICKGAIEIKPDCGYVFLVNDEEYLLETVRLWIEKVYEAFPNNNIAILPASMVQTVDVTLN